MFKILKDLGSIAENINQTPYDDDSSVSYLIERNNKEYILTKNNFYNDISGIHKWDLNIYENDNEKCGKLIYNHYEYFVDDITLKSKQDIFEVDDEFLKDLTEFAGKDLPLERKKLPSEREMLIEYIEEMKKMEIDIAPNSKSKKVLNFYEKANEYLDKFENLDKNILKKYDLQNEKISIFPSFKVKTKYGIPFDSSIDTTINKGLEDVINQTLGYKYLENMDIYNMKDWKILEEKGLVTIIPNIEENKEKEYSIKEILINKFSKNPEFIEKFEKDYIDSKIFKNNEKIKKVFSEEKYRDSLDKIQMLTDDLFYGKKAFPLSERENNNLMDKSFKELVNDAMSYAIKDLENLKKETTSDIELGNKISNLAVKSLENLFMKSDFELKNNYLGKKSEEFGLNLIDFSDPENPENYRKNIDDFLKSKITNEFINISIDTTDKLRKEGFEIPSLENNIFKEYDDLKQNLYNVWRERQEDLLVTGTDVNIDYKNKNVQKEIQELMKDILRKDDTNIGEIETFEKKYNKEHSIDNTISHKKNLIKEYNKISEKSEEITKQKEKEL